MRFFFLILFGLSFFSQGNDSLFHNISDSPEKQKNITIEIRINRSVYRQSTFGEAPQLAVWLENPETGEVRTLWVSHRTAKADWVGKIECLSCLPLWTNRYKQKYRTAAPPTREAPLAEGLSGATPKEKLVIRENIPAENTWVFYVEMNVSGDYNRFFPANNEWGVPDQEGNGQPSLIYKGMINPVKLPILIGYTMKNGEINYDLSPITTARKVIESIRISENIFNSKPG